ncbi:MAG: 50S ribosomal protein L25/general stress protein Ctc [Bifidobacteriaceae bacterium]|jgi:large subunit ribosomal protein L25|nr:50S ribosomal protein L25/general stress protein Ctc [Bifidobacteriaceae bacterium]
MKSFKFKANKRNDFGKGFARRIRSAGQVPAILYSKGAKPLHISLPSHEMALSLKSHNALYEIEIDGQSLLAIVKDAQRDPVGTVLEHIDFLSVNKGEKIRTSVDVRISGTPVPGLTHLQELQTILVKADPTALPEFISGSVEGFEEGHNLFVRDLEVPGGVEVVTDQDLPVAIVFEPKEEIIETPADEEAAEGDEEAAEGAEESDKSDKKDQTGDKSAGEKGGDKSGGEKGGAEADKKSDEKSDSKK